MEQLRQKISFYLQKQWVLILLLILSCIPAFATLFFQGYFNHHDDLQFMRIFEMEKCFRDGQIPCRWVPDMGFGYGYPLFNFYPPFPSYLGILIRSITPLQIIDTVKVSFALQIITAAVFMYLFARKWWGRLGGFLSAIFYTYAPYHAVDLYVRGALNEAWAMAFAPGVGWALTRLSEQVTFTNIVLVAVTTAGMLLSHNLMVLIFSPLLAVFALYLVVIKRSMKLLLAFGASGVLGAMLAAFFTLPVLLEQKFAHVDTLFIGYFNYTVHFATVGQMFLSRFWGYGGSLYGPRDEMAFPIGWLHWGAVVLLIPIGVWLLYKKKWQVAAVIAIFGAYFWFSAFGAHERSSAILWNRFSVIQTLQFPWRFLSTTAFTASFLAGAILLLPFPKLVRSTLFVSAVVAVFVLNIEFFHVEHRYPITDQDKMTGKLWDLQRTAGIYDYLPIYADVPPGRPAPGDYQILAGNPVITNFASGSATVRFTVKSNTPSTIRLNIFDFPNWKVWIDGKITPHDHENYLGLITFTAPQGNHSVKVSLTNTPIRTIGNAISLITILCIGGWYGSLFIIKRRNSKQVA